MKTKFGHWRCETHGCSSFNMNSLTRHEMPWCDIKKSIQYPTRPKTIGGYNGDLSRKYYSDWINYCDRKERDKMKMKNWKRQLKVLNETYEQTNINKYIEDRL